MPKERETLSGYQPIFLFLPLSLNFKLKNRKLSKNHNAKEIEYEKCQNEINIVNGKINAEDEKDKCLKKIL